MTTTTSPDAFSTDAWMRRFVQSAQAAKGGLTSLDQ
ncbi:dihydroxyacetone kinase, partial [Streptomyces sp. SID7982]|nr:dihydroxyacetone kinase [Streptomyces sp. SID7982]